MKMKTVFVKRTPQKKNSPPFSNENCRTFQSSDTLLPSMSCCLAFDGLALSPENITFLVRFKI